MKKIIAIILLCILFVIIIITTFKYQYYRKNNAVIAAVVSGGKYKIIAQDMLSGIKLCIEKLNKSGGINGRQIKLEVYDDKGNRNTAIKVALEISKKNNALFVLGHYFSLTSLAASKVYLKLKIPVITGSATADNITQKNDWYFSVLPNNSFQGEFIASFIRSSLGYKTCSIIYESNDYGKSLFKSFEKKARLLNIEIKKVFTFDTKNPKYALQIKRLIGELRSTANPGIIFLATYAAEGAKIISSLKYPGSSYEIIGPDSFSTNAFIKNLQRFPQEKTTPGYYSNGIYTTTPFIADFANDQNQQFILDYLNKYKKKPTWVSATYYDAAQIGIKALQEIDNFESIKNSRIIVKNELVGKYNLDTSEKGVCGPIFFNRNGNVNNPYRVGLYQNQSLVPYYSQFNIIENKPDDKKIFKKILNNKLITSGGIVMNKTRIVFTGIHVNKISKFDIHEGIYDLDFFLWFRFKGDEFNDKSIKFLNSVKPVELKNEFAIYRERDTVTHVYHLKEKFKTILDFKRFPFESHNLYIRFRHKEETSDRLIYVPDTINESLLNKRLNINKKLVIKTIPGWKAYDTSITNGITSYESSLGIPIRFHLKRPLVYSTCISSVSIKRDEYIFPCKVLFPALALFIALIVSSLLLFRHMTIFTIVMTSIMIISSIFILNSFAFFHKEYIMLIQYIYFSLFFLAMLNIILNAFILFYKKGYSKIKIYYILPIIMSLIILFGILYYGKKTSTFESIKRIDHIYDKNF
ncbi:membrane protein containing Extracellular ligand-binding receptor domain protein [Candidatus Magnetomorum sp. HK-1]|nr:membrane protein containing Extracellular ligand-binding receptor domain protein [Candidatus Magnetomorum sp. HK-1]